MMEAGGKLERFAVLGRALMDVVRKIIVHRNDDNIQCAVRVLKVGGGFGGASSNATDG